MPFKSKAQRRKFAEMLVKGEISAETFEEWNRQTRSAELPERVRPKAKKVATTAKKRRKLKRKPTSRRTKSRSSSKAKRRRNTSR